MILHFPSWTFRFSCFAFGIEASTYRCFDCLRDLMIVLDFVKSPIFQHLLWSIMVVVDLHLFLSSYQTCIAIHPCFYLSKASDWLHFTFSQDPTASVVFALAMDNWYFTRDHVKISVLPFCIRQNMNLSIQSAIGLSYLRYYVLHCSKYCWFDSDSQVSYNICLMKNAADFHFFLLKHRSRRNLARWSRLCFGGSGCYFLCGGILE